jgi:hypothetical protein
MDLDALIRWIVLLLLASSIPTLLPSVILSKLPSSEADDCCVVAIVLVKASLSKPIDVVP